MEPSIARPAPALRLARTVLAALGVAAMTFAGLMKIFNTDFRGDMAENYELFGVELLAGAAALTIFMSGALLLNLGFAKHVLVEVVRDQSGAWPANLVLAVLGLAIGFFALDSRKPETASTA